LLKNINRFWIAFPLLLHFIVIALFIASLQTPQVGNKLLLWDTTMALAAVNCIFLYVRLTQARNTDAGIGAIFVTIMVLPMIALLHSTGGYVMSLGTRKSFFIDWLSGREIVELPLLTLLLAMLFMGAVLFAALYLQRNKGPDVTKVRNQPIN
jgi:hypothetical protein